MIGKSETSEMTPEEWVAYLNLNKFEKSLINNPLPKNSWEKYYKWERGGIKHCEERSLEDVIEYKRKRVHNKIFRWLRDGRVRLQRTVDEKEKSVNLYSEKVWGTWAVDDGMIKKLERKRLRLKYYKDKVDHIDYVMENYTEFTYEELEGIPDRIFRYD